MHPTSEATALSLLAVEDDPAYGALLREVVAAEDPDVQLDSANTLAGAIAHLHGRGADCVLLDLSLPDAAGLAGLEALAAEFPALPIVVLTNTDEESTALAAVAHGAEDFLAKSRADGATILRAVRYARGRKAAEAELRRTGAQLAAAEQLAQLGSWEWDLMTHTVRPSRTLCRIYGVDERELGGDFERLMECVHPDDRPSLDSAIEHALAGDGARFEASYRVVRPGGEERLIQGVAQVRRDASGRPASILGVALDVTERARDHATVEALQRSLLPRSLPDIPGTELGACYRPAGAGNRVGGDFYDVFPLGADSWLLLIGDVAGKGPEAAALSALARYTVRADAQRDPDPARLLELLNEALVREGQRFCTAACARLDLVNGGGELTTAVAGHPPPILVRGGSASPLASTGTLLGCYPKISIEPRREQLAREDAVVLYTDGVTDARAPETLLEQEDIAELASTSADLPASDLAARLGRAALPDGGAGRDDIAVLVIKMGG
ncbi:MAG TPA: SpoIIE family protein phosphatase [Thermoleophilaceae bacterium]|jgi:PAS domain S-box-containing protein